MPKLLVLFQSRSPDVVRLAEAAAEGARSVRFAEVDLRHVSAAAAAPHDPVLDATGRAHRALAHPDEIAVYDGLILGVDGANAASGGEDALVRALSAFHGTLMNKVGSALTPGWGPDRRVILWSVLTTMADRGMILVPAPFEDEGEAAAESARRVGKRVAEVVGWVTHARSHHHHDHHHHDDRPRHQH